MNILAIGQMTLDVPLGPVPDHILQMEKAEIEPVEVTTGGDALNVAVTLSKLGASAGIIGRIGEDQNGRIILEQCASHGVDTGRVIVDGRFPTAVSYLLLDKNGEKHSLSNTAIYHELRADDVPDETIRSAEIVFFGSAFQMRQMDDGGIEKLFKRAHRFRRLTAMDAAIGDDIPGRRELLRKLGPAFAQTDIFIPSYKEASYLAGETRVEDIASFFAGYGIGIFGIKLGSGGCYLSDHGKGFYLPSFRDFTPVDTTGAGDSFMGGFLRGMLEGWDVRSSAVFASAVAAHNIAGKGATGGVPGFAAVMKFLERKGIRISR